MEIVQRRQNCFGGFMKVEVVVKKDAFDLACFGAGDFVRIDIIPRWFMVMAS